MFYFTRVAVLLLIVAVVGCSNSTSVGREVSGTDSTNPADSVRVVGNIVVPPTATLVPVEGKPLPLIVTKFRGVGN